MGTPASRRGIRSRGRRGREKGAAEKKKKALYACKAERSRGIMVGQGSGDGENEGCRRQDATGPICNLNPFRVNSVLHMQRDRFAFRFHEGLEHASKSHGEFFTVHRDSGRNATAREKAGKSGDDMRREDCTNVMASDFT